LIFFSFAGEGPANENLPVLQGWKLQKIRNQGYVKGCDDIVFSEGLLFFTFWPPSRK